MAVGKAVLMLDAVARVTGTMPYGVNMKMPEILLARF
jgi:hypothetical protein